MRARARARPRGRARGPCNKTRPAADASFETFHSKAPETVGFRVSGGHGQVTTVNIFNFNRVASHLGGVGFHTIARVETPTVRTVRVSIIYRMHYLGEARGIRSVFMNWIRICVQTVHWNLATSTVLLVFIVPVRCSGT